MLDFLSKFGLKPYKKQVVVHGFIRPRPLQNRVPRVQVLLPLPRNAGIALRCLYFLSVRKILVTRHARAGQQTRPLPVADEGSVCWRSGRKNQGKAQARRFFRVTARGHSLPSAPAKSKSLEISLNCAVSRLFFIQ